MGKKSLDRKAARKFIVEARENGKTDQEIYNELTQEYYDKKSVALLITGTPTKANRHKYRTLNNILIGLLCTTVVIKIIAVENLAIESGNMFGLLLVFIVPILNIYFIFEIGKYNAPIYKLCGILVITGFLSTIGKVNSFDTIVAVETALVVAIAALSFYLDGKLFPNFSPRSLKKDTNGEYVLNRTPR